MAILQLHRPFAWRMASLVLLGLIVAMVLWLPRSSDAASDGNNPPTNVSCQGWERDTVIISWKDNDNDETDYRIERSVDGGAFTEIKTVTPDANGNYAPYSEKGIDITKNHRYRVRGHHADNSFTDYGPICNNRRVAETGGAGNGFRIFFGVNGLLNGVTDDCPMIDGNRVCLTNTQSGGQNVFVQLQREALDGSAKAFQRVGFDRDASVPSGGLDKIPVNVIWCDGGGCAGGSSLGLSPFLMETAFDLNTRAGDPIAWLVGEHETFHFQQFKYGGLNDPAGAWVIEGQARFSQDSICIGADRNTAKCFDDIATGYAGYVPEINGYLANPTTPVNQASYGAALFWAYVTRFGTNPPFTDKTEGGMNLLAQFWKESAANPNRDGIAVLNSALQTLGSPRRFRDIWKDFAVANYAKNLTGPGVPDKYKYPDMAETGGAYNNVALAVNQTLALNQPVLRNLETIYPWSARYYVFRPDTNVPLLDLKVRQFSNVPVYYTVIGQKNNGIAHEYNIEARDLDYTLLNNAYDRVVVIVAGLENLANYRLSVNGTTPTLNILTPTTANKARVGSPSAPDKFRVTVELLAGDGTPLSGVDLSQFHFRVGTKDVPAGNILTSAKIMGQEWFVLRAPAQDNPNPAQYDLHVDYASSAILSDTETLAVDYTPRNDADSVLVIDRSGSMGFFGGAPLAAAKDSAKLYVDSWRTGDKIGIVTFNHLVTTDMALTDWTDAPSGGTRKQAFDTINGLSAGGGTNIGDALIAGFGQLTASGNTSHDWALVLLSDGKEEASSPVVTFPNAINQIATASGKRP
ncbi:MAG TPA: vWA domain-containing protein, partial [Caldilineaceae bacterium]|nr:vWA domain-containing protein [Caldilineaceae bacterium]